MLRNFSWVAFIIGILFSMFVLPFVQGKLLAGRTKTAPTASRTA